MARIIYSGLVQSINGSIAGTTFQRNAYGFTIKAKPNIVNPNRQRQAPARAALQVVALRWRQISQTNRNTWNAYATANPNASRKNPNSFLNGQALFYRTNLLNLKCNRAIQETCTTNALSTLILGTIEIQRVGSNLIYFDDSSDSLNTLDVIAYLSAPVPQSRTYDRSDTRFMSSYPISLFNSIQIQTEYSAQFGRLPDIGEFVFVRRIYYRQTTGQVIEYPPQRFQVL